MGATFLYGLMVLFPGLRAYSTRQDSQAFFRDAPLEQPIIREYEDPIASYAYSEEIRARAKAAVIGAFVADAASMPLHWIYDSALIDSLVESNAPEFFDPPSCPFYEYALGELSPYGDEALPLLQSIAARGELDPEGFSKDLLVAFENYRGRLNHASKAFMHNMRSGHRWPNCGVNDDQAHSLVKVPAVVARYAGSPLLAIKMEQAIRVHQDNQMAVDLGVAAARILEKVVLGDSVHAALEWARGDASSLPPSAVDLVRRVFHPTVLKKSTRDAVAAFGKSCHLPESFLGPVHALAVAHNFTHATRVNIYAGGDSCSRAAFIAACFAAQDGLGAIPAEWTRKVRRIGEIHRLADQVAAQLLVV